MVGDAEDCKSRGPAILQVVATMRERSGHHPAPAAVVVRRRRRR